MSDSGINEAVQAAGQSTVIIEGRIREPTIFYHSCDEDGRRIDYTRQGIENLTRSVDYVNNLLNKMAHHISGTLDLIKQICSSAGYQHKAVLDDIVSDPEEAGSKLSAFFSDILNRMNLMAAAEVELPEQKDGIQYNLMHYAVTKTPGKLFRLGNFPSQMVSADYLKIVTAGFMKQKAGNEVFFWNTSLLKPELINGAGEVFDGDIRPEIKDPIFGKLIEEELYHFYLDQVAEGY